MIGRLVGVVGEDVPSAELELVELRERHEVGDLGRALVGALAEADRPHLRERADGDALPLRASITPAMVVVATAPMPGSSTPELAFGADESVSVSSWFPRASVEIPRP